MYRATSLLPKRSFPLWKAAASSVVAHNRKSLSTLPKEASALFFARAHTRTASSYASIGLRRFQNLPNLSRGTWRCLSTGGKQSKPKNKETGGEDGSSELVLTPGQKVVAASRLTMWAGILTFASVCAYYIGSELMPTKMSANRIFDGALAILREDPEVRRRFGDSLKAYGRDHGGHREGRRNFVEHTEYTSEDDDSKRMRVRFNLEGRFGEAFVFVEQSKTMPAGEFVYVLVQDKANGRVITVVDNRHKMAATRLAGGSKEGQEAFANLLSGGNK